MLERWKDGRKGAYLDWLDAFETADVRRLHDLRAGLLASTMCRLSPWGRRRVVPAAVDSDAMPGMFVVVFVMVRVE